ncbi:hypothetical protein F4820DRAFT_4916 [Hypoxylon rubiginosum]|uniref:Uncharacterized protein n=1 Tax=Hypoxylon rubiginosum TaxID=110542 RepID=A0ACB9ZIG2_9PEZI|nr:hypothetical protein F4820DRAFT_4916 [Hypoxylon rubiginosum]
MPQDPNLYGQRPPKRQKKEIPLSSSLDFASQLTSLLSNPSSSSSTAAPATSGRPRPSKTKDDIFNVKAKRKAGSTATAAAADGNSSSSRKDGKLQLKDPHGTEEDKQDFMRARRKMEEKARLYAAMKRGDYIAKDGDTAPLVDFDRKWAEKHPEDDPDRANNSSSGTDNESDEEEQEEEIVEFKDEFGRTRRATRAEMLRIQRRSQRSALGAAELESMAAKPTRAPERLLFGDVIQSSAFAPEDATINRMADLAARRDKEPTPPPDAHFDGAAEIRTKGVGFYQFSRGDEERRRREMEGLAAEREATERARKGREEAREARKRDIEDRRRKIGAKRAERLAESFLDGLAGEIGTAAAAGGGKDGEKGVEEKGKEKEREKEKVEKEDGTAREKSPS